ncbi:MAG: RHS repeat-associated core domain-containing protein, partial [Thiothrix sp.]
ARWYDPALGHVLSPDSIVPEAGNALDYHRYAYVRFNPLKYTDPTGHCVFGLDTVVCAIAAAAAIGAAANAAGNVVGQVIEQYDGNRGFLENIQSTQINGQKVAIAAGWGAVGGGAAPVTGPLGFVAVNAAAGAGQKVTTDVLVSGKPLHEAVLDPNTAVAAGIGALGAKVGGPMPKIPSYVASNGETVLFSVGKEAVALGGKEFAQNTSRMLLSQQFASSVSARSLAGAMIANIPVSAPSSCSGISCWLQEMLDDNQTPLPCTIDLDDE